MTISLCGLGNMGGAIAGRLAAHDTLLAYDVDAERVARAAETPNVTPAELAGLSSSDIVVLSLPTPKISLEVIGTLAPKMRPGSVIVETSTVNPADVHEQVRRCDEHGVGLVDAAILSGVAQMANGRATLLVGGREPDVRKAEPVLRAMSERIMRFGEPGSGMAAKVINNAVAHAVMVVLVEAGALAAATGVSGGELVELLTGPDAGLTRPLTHRFAERILRGDYEGGMPTEAARKDSTLALAMAQQTGVPLFAVQSAHTVYELGVAQGLGRLDYAAIATLWEQWTGRPMNETTQETGDDS
ncbi:NAD(P)-dependent oxidoreductase [Actinoallomurus iriomotensis]|uniref:3-hydroxyisobutyrate dehydrogenase n=1 Tax=Actinoallomurus iriomotensis TaxID=478107 RepID=A0A9W6VJ51_9ACTN|nr:NAD(P)-dependent oxidoreductase [Actinoallomurus iriomotensis]GLY73673.1 3-hydroxyisobutyrate dehydrogenase [Actinoallomurus iriomotensis]